MEPESLCSSIGCFITAQARKWCQASLFWLPGQELGKNPSFSSNCPLAQWFSTRVILPPKGYLTTLGDIFGCHMGRECYCHPVDRGQDLTMRKMRPPSSPLPSQEFSVSEISSARVGQPALAFLQLSWFRKKVTRVVTSLELRCNPFLPSLTENWKIVLWFLGARLLKKPEDEWLSVVE